MPVIIGTGGNPISLDDAKDQLAITTSTYDAKLQGFVDAASQMVANVIGPMGGATVVSEYHDGGSDRIVVRQPSPIVSVTSVLESIGTMVYTLTEVDLDAGAGGGAYEFTVDLSLGVVVRRASGVAIPFMDGIRNIHITYVAGYATVPADIKQATLLLLQHMWETQRGGATTHPGLGSASDIRPGAGYAFPRRVMEILDPYTMPGIG